MLIKFCNLFQEETSLPIALIIGILEFIPHMGKAAPLSLIIKIHIDIIAITLQGFDLGVVRKIL